MVPYVDIIGLCQSATLQITQTKEYKLIVRSVILFSGNIDNIDKMLSSRH